VAAAGETCDAEGRLVCGGPVETHIHRDKSRIAARVPPPAGRRVNPVAMTAPVKKDFTAADVYARAEASW
jgi:cytosine/creatinine deaminase